MNRRTVMIPGSDEVMAIFGDFKTFYRGRWQNVRVIKIGEAEDTPLNVRKSLVGLIIPTIFSKEEIEAQTGAEFPIPKGSRLAYPLDVIKVLKSSSKHEAAKQLRGIVPDPLDMYVIEKEIYELV